MRVVEHPAARRLRAGRARGPVDVYSVRRREAFYRIAASICVHRGHRRVLDIDCDDGFGTAICGAAGLEAVGTGPDPDALDRAARTYGTDRVVFREARLPGTREPQHGFDAVVCLGLVERLPDPRPLLREARRVLRPEGAFICGTPNRLTASPGRTRPIAGDHAWEYTPDEFWRVLGWSFAVVRLHGLHHGRRLRLLQRAVGEPLPLLLDRVVPADRTAWLRWALRGLGAEDFVVDAGELREALDLVSVAHA